MRLERVRVNDGRDGVGRVVKAVHELEAERDQERDPEQNEREHRRRVHVRYVRDELRARIDEARREHPAEDDRRYLAGARLIFESRADSGLGSAIPGAVVIAMVHVSGAWEYTGPGGATVTIL